jgi:hypothetical protein
LPDEIAKAVPKVGRHFAKVVNYRKLISLRQSDETVKRDWFYYLDD